MGDNPVDVGKCEPGLLEQVVEQLRQVPGCQAEDPFALHGKTGQRCEGLIDAARMKARATGRDLAQLGAFCLGFQT